MNQFQGSRVQTLTIPFEFKISNLNENAKTELTVNEDFAIRWWAIVNRSESTQQAPLGREIGASHRSYIRTDTPTLL